MELPLKFVSQRIEEYALQVTYEPEENTGKVIYNLSFIRSEDYEAAIRTILDAWATGLCVSDRIKFIESGEAIDGLVIPEDTVGICTVCSITLDAMLLKKGVPLNFIGGGIVEIEERLPRRFTALIRYEDTTIDPLGALLSQEITSVSGVMNTGNGSILANIRECHMEAEAVVGQVLDTLIVAGYTGILDVGIPNTPLLGVPVTADYGGIAIIGGTNPIAALREQGKWVKVQSLKGLVDISEMDYIENY